MFPYSVQTTSRLSYTLKLEALGSLATLLLAINLIDVTFRKAVIMRSSQRIHLRRSNRNEQSLTLKASFCSTSFRNSTQHAFALCCLLRHKDSTGTNLIFIHFYSFHFHGERVGAGK
jgi:hypothetical protein